jgi:hypothetical protein
VVLEKTGACPGRDQGGGWRREPEPLAQLLVRDQRRDPLSISTSKITVGDTPQRLAAARTLSFSAARRSCTSAATAARVASRAVAGGRTSDIHSVL